MSKFNDGEIWFNARGKHLEILATDSIETHNAAGEGETVEVIAYSFLGGRRVYIIEAAWTDAWTKEN